MSFFRAFIIVFALQNSSATYAKTPITKQNVVSVKEGLSNYTSCKNSALEKARSAKTGKTKKALLGKYLYQCREEYPSFFMMSLCKSKALKNYSSSPTDFKLAMKDCRYEYSKLKYNPKSIIPVTWHKDKIYFAGVGLNSPLKISEKNEGLGLKKQFGNLNCENVINSKKQASLVEYILIGNNIKSWRPFAHSDAKKLITKFGFEKNETKVFSEALGEVIKESGSDSLLNYLPSASCHFDRNLKHSIDGIKIYYLLGKNKTEATPYFGIAFYKKRKKPLVKSLISKLRDQWPYSSFATKKENYTLISQYPVTEFDFQGDPKNLCKGSRSNTEVIIVGHYNKPKRADFIVVANIENLCNFGDKAASQFLKEFKDSKL